MDDNLKTREQLIRELAALRRRFASQGRRSARERRLLAALLAGTNDAVVVVGPQRRLCECNAAAVTLLGYRREELLGQPLTMILPGKSGAVLDFWRMPPDAEAPGGAKVSLRRKDGSIVALAATAMRLDSARSPEAVLVVRDAAANAWMEAELAQLLRRSQKTISGVIQALALTVESRDPFTAGHQERVANLAGAIAREMALSDERIEAIRIAGSIHDLGKVRIPAEILSRPGALSPMEMEIIKTHAEVGYEILEKIDFPWPIADIVRQHHERLDGSGYPQHLKGKDICLEAKILAVADVVEAMGSHRPYRPSLGVTHALGEIAGNKEAWYDGAVTDACLSLFNEKGFSFNNLFATLPQFGRRQEPA